MSRPVTSMVCGFLLAVCGQWAVMVSHAEDQPALPGLTHAQLEERLAQPVDRFEFRQTPIDKAAAEIARKYGVPIDTSLARKWSQEPAEPQKVTVTVADVSLRQAVAVLAEAANCDLKPTADDGRWTMHMVSREVIEYGERNPRGRGRAAPPKPNTSPAEVHLIFRELTQADFVDTALIDALTFFSDFHGVPFVFSADPKLRESVVTLKAEGVPLQKVLEKLLDPLELATLRDGTGIKVVSRETAEKTRLTYLYNIPTAGDDRVKLKDPVKVVTIAARGEADPPAQVRLVGGKLLVTGTQRQQERIERLFERLKEAPEN